MKDNKELKMKMMRWSTWVLICAVVAVTSIEIWASGPVAVYALVDKVVFEPNEAKPERIQIWGAFSLAGEPYSSNYTSAQKGYLYYKIDEGTAAFAQPTRSAWADIKKVAGTGETIGFGGGYASKGSGKLRKTTDKPNSPDPYPIGNAVVKLGSAQAPITAQLKAALAAK
jgi:hypothetical protein